MSFKKNTHTGTKQKIHEIKNLIIQKNNYNKMKINKKLSFTKKLKTKKCYLYT